MEFYINNKFESEYLYNHTDNNKLINLKVFTKNTEISLEDTVKIIRKIIDIFENIKNSGYILGSVNIEDFFIDENDISNIKFKYNRRFLKNNDLLENYTIGNISAPEVLNKQFNAINKSTDVYLIGKLLIEVFFGNKIKPRSYIEERYLAYNINYFSSDIIIGLHEFLEKTTNLLNEDRYSSVKECREILDSIINENEIRKSSIHINKSIEVSCSAKTDPGIGKSKLFTSKGKSLDKINEDTILVLKGTKKDRFFFMVADGISNCSYGSGYDASNILKRVCNFLWNEEEQYLANKEDIERFFNHVIKFANETILNYALKGVEEKENLKLQDLNGIMATTFSAGIVLNNKLYYLNLGDSPIYMLSKDKKLSLISKEDNIGNEILIKSKSWIDYENLDSKTSLTKYIGGVGDKSTIELKEIGLLDQDILLICSDGLTNYIGNELDIKGIWSIDNDIKHILLEQRNLKNITDILIKEANKNGGGDNISVVLTKFYIN